MLDLESLLTGHPFVEAVGVFRLPFLAEHAEVVQFSEDEIIANEDEPAEDFYLITAGLVALEIHSPRRDTLVIRTLKRGDVLGTSWLSSRQRWQFTVRAVEPVQAVKVLAEPTRRLCIEDCPFGFSVMSYFTRAISSRLRSTRLQLADLYQRRGGE